MLISKRLAHHPLQNTPLPEFIVWLSGLVFMVLLVGTGEALAATDTSNLPATMMTRLQSSQPIDVLVEYQAQAVELEVTNQRRLRRLNYDDNALLNLRAQRYAAIKSSVNNAVTKAGGIEILRDYSHLPMAHLRFRSLAALTAYLAQAAVIDVYENKSYQHTLASTLPFINQPAVQAVGYRGAGGTVAVIDDGIDYTGSAFGSCTAPSVPSSCKVAASVSFGSGTTDTGHGTNVSAIVLGVAPDSRVAMLNAFSGTTAFSSDIIAAINWSISNKNTYNIVAINMSLGDGSSNASACSSGNSFLTPITNARNAGMSVVAASGNSGYINGISNPACTPGAVSVGAVYDGSYGNVSYGTCSDTTTFADQVTCFSNSANYLTMLAPGFSVTAAGLTYSGTSQATPHVSGALAVLRAAFPNETLTQAEARLTSNGVSVNDSRNGIIKPRLNLLASARPVNDNFTNRSTISGTSGTASGPSLLATKETGEPNHAGNAGASSVWWKWTAPAAGQVSLNTHGSSFNTLLAVYTGTAVNTLTPVVSNDDDGSSGNTSGLLFQAQSGQQYQIAVDGVNAAAGNVTLNWSLNTSAQANLSVGLTGPNSAIAGSTSVYTLSITNAGPNTATNVSSILTLPASASFVSGSSGCVSTSATLVTCQTSTLANGSSIVFNITVQWSSGGSIAALSASTSSDVTDPSASNNSAVYQVSITAVDTDVPTLPEWGAILMGLILLFTGLHKNRKMPA